MVVSLWKIGIKMVGKVSELILWDVLQINFTHRACVREMEIFRLQKLPDTEVEPRCVYLKTLAIMLCFFLDVLTRKKARHESWDSPSQSPYSSSVSEGLVCGSSSSFVDQHPVNLFKYTLDAISLAPLSPTVLLWKYKGDLKLPQVASWGFPSWGWILIQHSQLCAIASNYKLDQH